ncbi:hypothetical protein Neosp_004348 [[Neocosmospora] mangrovei]
MSSDADARQQARAFGGLLVEVIAATEEGKHVVIHAVAPPPGQKKGGHKATFTSAFNGLGNRWREAVEQASVSHPLRGLPERTYLHY